MTLLRSVLFDFTFYLWTALLSLLALPALFVSQRAAASVSKVWAIVSLLLLRLIVGLSYEVRGRENLPEGAVIVALKHQSAWETIALWVLFKNPAIVMKQSLARIPVFGWYMKRGQAIIIDRDAGPKALRSMVAAARSAVAEGRPIAIFPEGTRTPAGARQPYQPGVAALYMQLGLPIVPVALNSGLFWGRRSFLKRSGRILVEFLPSIEPGLDRRRVMTELERRIEDATAMLISESTRALNISRAIPAAY
ncbi:lysophospholipid acyltransferase family protein [Roseiarcaceae bacterium H3SJ34-1]|uniref:lysophospholipid acyltransferase family protein n=1 Tax=Terripilifer ovatus TaxID=3032367 RepID=UPI003AB970CE|nr:lysophospholipid acyltransferase family protein [Roseiarcaceae bacterium H3SJ34-1]